MPDWILRELTVDDEPAFRTAVRQFHEVDPDWDFAFHFGEDTDFSRYVEHLARQREGHDVPQGWVASTYLVAFVDGVVVGRLSLRHQLSEFLASFGGHIGYGVVPNHRRRGYATRMLAESLPIARELGIGRVLLTCDDDNVGSSTTIERCGGVLQDRIAQPNTSVLKRRYWIDT